MAKDTLLYKSKLKQTRDNGDGTYEAVDDKGRKWSRCDSDGCLNTNFDFVLFQNETPIQTSGSEKPSNKPLMIALGALAIGVAAVIVYYVTNKKK